MNTTFDKAWVDPRAKVEVPAFIKDGFDTTDAEAVLLNSFFRTKPVGPPNAIFSSAFLTKPSATVESVVTTVSAMPAGSKPSNPKDVMGVKKAPMSTVSALVLAEVGVGMLEGALNYGRHNYRVVGVLASIYYDATLRHLRSWWEGEDIDPKSQLHHVTKAITSLVVLRDAMILEMYTDDRPPRMANVTKFFADLDARAAALVERDGHIQPTHYTEKNKGG